MVNKNDVSNFRLIILSFRPQCPYYPWSKVRTHNNIAVLHKLIKHYALYASEILPKDLYIAMPYLY